MIVATFPARPLTARQYHRLRPRCARVIGGGLRSTKPCPAKAQPGKSYCGNCLRYFARRAAGVAR